MSFGAFGANMDARLAKADEVCGGYEVFHINGVLTDLAKATDNLNELRAAYGNSYKEHLIEYHLAYNQTRDPGGDLIDCYNQVLRAYPGTTMEDFTRAVMLGIGSNILTANIVSKLAGQWAKLFNMDRPAVYTDQDVINVADAIFGRHKKNGRMLLIPHSQGNFYTNLIYPKLITGGQYGSYWAIAAKAIQTLALASPADRIEGVGVNITNRNDNVINSVRALFPKTLGGNITIPVVDLLGHNLIGVYLRSGLPGRAAITNGMTLRFDALKSTQNGPTAWLENWGHLYKCGPAPYPYGTGVEPQSEIQCLIPDSNFLFTDQDYVQYNVVGVAEYLYISPGTAAQAASAATAQVKGCYSKFIADRKARLLAGATIYSAANDILGCGYGYPWQEPYGRSMAAWHIYSGDVPGVQLTTLSANPKVDSYRATLKPLCKW